jgi:transcriptional antiterminator RfaH
MPILQAETDYYPETLWDGARTSLSGVEHWWCLHTKPRQEKKTARFLVSRGMSFYLPQTDRVTRMPSGRVARSRIPLFPGYCFYFGDAEGRLAVFESKTLVRILECPDPLGLERDLRQVREMLAAGLEVASEPHYPVGSWVRVVNGPLQGMVGMIDQRGKRDRFVAIVRTLGQGVSVELRDWQVELAEERGARAGIERSAGDVTRNRHAGHSPLASKPPALWPTLGTRETCNWSSRRPFA